MQILHKMKNISKMGLSRMGRKRSGYDQLEEFDTKGQEWYCPERWVPHCTVALTGEDYDEAFYEASDLVLHEFEKMSGNFTEIGLVKITFPVEEIYTANLQG